MADEAKPALPLFPIQLRKVDIGEVAYNSEGFSDPGVAPSGNFDLNVAVSQIVAGEEGRTIQVTLTFSLSTPPEGTSHPYSLRMALHGEFAIGEVKMDDAAIIKWGNRNGALILMPFLREAVYTFTLKTGWRPIFIPLVETTAFGVKAPAPREDVKTAMAAIAPARSAEKVPQPAPAGETKA